MLKKVAVTDLITTQSHLPADKILINNHFLPVISIEHYPGHGNSGDLTEVEYGYNRNRITFSRYAEVLVWREK